MEKDEQIKITNLAGEEEKEVKINMGDDAGEATLHLQGDKLVSVNDEPSVEHDNMSIWTNENGTVHRLAGPAVIDINEEQERYFINGAGMTKEEWEKHPDVIEYNESKK